MDIVIERNGKAVASASGADELYLVFREEYQEGDRIIFSPGEAGFYTVQFDAVLGRATLFSNGKDYILPVPFGPGYWLFRRGWEGFLPAGWFAGPWFWPPSPGLADDVILSYFPPGHNCFSRRNFPRFIVKT